MSDSSTGVFRRLTKGDFFVLVQCTCGFTYEYLYDRVRCTRCGAFFPMGLVEKNGGEYIPPKSNGVEDRGKSEALQIQTVLLVADSLYRHALQLIEDPDLLDYKPGFMERFAEVAERYKKERRSVGE